MLSEEDTSRDFVSIEHIDFYSFFRARKSHVYASLQKSSDDNEIEFGSLLPFVQTRKKELTIISGRARDWGNARGNQQRRRGPDERATSPKPRVLSHISRTISPGEVFDVRSLARSLGRFLRVTKLRVGRLKQGEVSCADESVISSPREAER